jgi:hypothetical protein
MRFPLSVKESVALTFCHGNRECLAGNGGPSVCAATNFRARPQRLRAPFRVWDTEGQLVISG